MTPRWRTALDTPLARLLGIEAHTVIFRHRDDPGGPGRVVGIEIPETAKPTGQGDGQPTYHGLQTLGRCSRSRTCVRMRCRK
jgi:hypothetical protein